MSVALTTGLLQQIAGWQAVKEGRALVAAGKVLEASWEAPELRGVVQTSAGTFKTGLTIHSVAHVETHCSCRQARQEGTLCAHAVAVGLQVLEPPKAPSAGNRAAVAASPSPAASPRSREPQRLQRSAEAGAGEPLTLHLLLPPNLPEAAARGKVMLVIEAQVGGRRSPLNAVPRGRPYLVSPEDAPVLTAIEDVAGEPAGMMVVPAANFGRILATMIGHPRVTLGRAAAVEVSASPTPVRLKASLESSGEMTLQLAQAGPPCFRLGNQLWTLSGKTLAPLGLPAFCEAVLSGPLRIPRPEVPVFLSQHWPALVASAAVEAAFDLEQLRLEFETPTFVLRLSGGLAQLDAELMARYGANEFPVGRVTAGVGLWTPDPADPLRYRARDLPAEQAATARLIRAGFSAPDAQGRARLEGEDAVLTFFAREFPRLERDWTVTLEERLERSTRTKLERIEPTFRVTPSGQEWFELRVGYETRGGEPLPAAEIQRLLLSGRNHTRLKNGRLALIDTGAVEELQQVLLDSEPHQEAGAYRIAADRAGFVAGTIREQPGWKLEAPAAWRERVGAQLGEAALPCPPLGELEAVLRPYQKEGVAWLWWLRQNGFGGVLADEMGLGKTLQALALVAASRQGGPGEVPPALVICPTSLVPNWVLEARRFAPRLRVLALSGPERHAAFSRLGDSDLVITSYALARRDVDRYRGMEFDTVILDEAQHIKNRETQNAQAVKAIRARHRLALTGTPLENSVLDLWSLFDFLMPGYLGAARDFRERYEVPITRDRDAAVQARLARRVRPFLRRRLKRDVAADLPPKIEQVAFCELTPQQAAVYRQLLEAGRQEVLEAVGRQGLAKSRMLVLTTLLRLRQVCCDLRLLKLPDANPETASAKLELFGELLEEMVDGGHRALVFSQFTTMLGLLRERVTALGLDHCYLDGATTDRAGVVQRFQANAGIPVFLISLKAGGTGLNLTGADTVIHFDPWWNPAVEAQATDRAHRIGQTRVVTSYKLIARDTVEEKILRLQERKRETLQALLGDEEQLAAALSWEEIQDLLSA
ncbi:MAG: SNF2 helicase associated domain-containing protein [Verrucomicrobia bacterium]|nr:SNF2 helicase associated domain-containing protein [Verrucomicrobiota bacterium]